MTLHFTGISNSSSIKKRFACGSPFQKALGLGNAGKVLRLVCELYYLKNIVPQIVFFEKAHTKAICPYRNRIQRYKRLCTLLAFPIHQALKKGSPAARLFKKLSVLEMPVKSSILYFSYYLKNIVPQIFLG